MSKPFALQSLLHLSQKKNDAATKKLGQLNSHQQSAQSKLEMLQQYRRDYQQKMQEAERNGMDLHELCNFRDFIYRLDDAIAQQNTAVTQATSSVQHGLSELSATQRSMKSYDTLAVRHQASENKKAAKIEQTMQDEHSARSVAYKKSEQDEKN